MLKVVVGHSNDPAAQDAAKDVIAQCQVALDGHMPQAGVVFAAIDFEHEEILDTILTVFPGLALVGCTTDGEMSSELAFQQDSLVLMLFCSDTVQIGAGIGRHLSTDPQRAAEQAIATARESHPSSARHPEPALCLAFPESLTLDSAAIVASLQHALGETVPLLGGFAGDQAHFQRCYQFYGREVLTDALPILLFYGDLKVSHGVAHGWTPVGTKGEITQAEDHFLREIDHKPALDFYRYYMNDLVPSTEFPLAIFEEGAGEHYYLRVSIGYDLETGTIKAIPHWPQKARVQLAQGSRDDILGGAITSFQQALSRYPGQQVDAALIFSCCVRRNLLGTRTKLEYELAQQGFEQGLSVAGFYTYGEIAALAPNTPAKAHHASFVTLLLGTV